MWTKQQLGRRWAGVLPAALVFVLLTQAAADEIHLRHGARVRGQWLNPDKTSAQSYLVRTTDGVELCLAVDQVATVDRDRPAEREYQIRAASIADNLEQHWQLAEWCRQQGLRERRRDHLRRVVQLDPQHVRARRALGYTQLEGNWVTQAEFLTEKGYVYYKGRWRLPQEVTLLQEAKERSSAEQGWLQKLRNWRKQLLAGEPHEATLALERLRALRDPAAIGPLTRVLREDRLWRMRLLWIEILSQIDDTRSTAALLGTALYDADEEVFHACLECLVARRTPALVRACVEALHSRSNRCVNRSAYLLGALDDPSAISPLIDALVTIHFRLIPGSSRTTYSLIRPAPGSPTNFGFTPATGFFPLAGLPMGPQLSMPRGPKLVPVRRTNQEVLDALVRLAQGTSFAYNQQAWRNWYAQQNQVTVRQ